jgi:glyoxylase-like metal-dependent hydrolase (beta-lactamase superfamily II)
VNTHPAPDVFPPPPSANPSAVSLALPSPNPTRIDEGVYFLGGAINSLAVVMEEFVLLVEGAWTDSLAQGNIDAVKRIAPGKPIRYVVATHYHHDHIRGLRNYMQEGATIVATAITRSEITRLAATTPLLRPDALALRPVPPRFETVMGRRTITDGVHTVELYDIGPTPHVDEMLIVYLPKERVLYEADALDINGSEVPQFNADTLDMVEKIRGLGLDPRVIVPAHGRLGTIDDLRRALERRETGAGRN